MRWLSIGFCLGLFNAPPALAYHCPHGQLYRIRMGRCVDLGSPLAFPFEGRRTVVEAHDWTVEITKMPPLPPDPPDARSPQDIQDQAEHDAAVAGHKDELNKLLHLLQEQKL